ncbi:MAG: sulfatase [Bryobacterales bacterium]
MSRLVWLSLLFACSAFAQPKTNVVFILVDDLGWRDLGCYGSPFYETPNVDGLASSGVRFTNGYAACPVCSPTRSSIMTGKYPVRVGITDYINPQGRNQPASWTRNTKLLPAAYADRLALGETTLAEAFKANGYATFFAGKWHLGPEGFYPENQGFDVNKGGIEQGGPYGGKRYFSPYGNPRLEDGPDGEHLPERLGRETAAFITQHKDEPFLAYLSFYSVHTPLMARADLERKYRAKAQIMGFHGPAFLVEGTREARQKQEHAIYAGMVEAMDQAVGVVLRAIENAGVADHTVVVFMSDNGGLSTSEGSPTSNVPLRGGKGWMYEGGIREPLIVRAPGVTKAGRVEETPVSSVDFFPTLLELAGLQAMPEQHVDGVSLAGLLSGKPLDRGPLYWHYPHYGNQGGAPSGAIRDGEWKLIEWYEEGELELFNLRQDISEKYNLVELYPERTQRMRAMLQQWRERTGAVMPPPNPNYDPAKLSGRRP